MPLDPVQTVRRYLDALLAGDLDTIRDSFAEDAIWRMHGDLPLAGPWQGRDRIVDDFLSKVGASLFEPGSQHAHCAYAAILSAKREDENVAGSGLEDTVKHMPQLPDRRTFETDCVSRRKIIDVALTGFAHAQ